MRALVINCSPVRNGATAEIVNIIRKLEDSGEIIISRGGGDDIVV